MIAWVGEWVPPGTEDYPDNWPAHPGREIGLIVSCRAWAGSMIWNEATNIFQWVSHFTCGVISEACKSSNNKIKSSTCYLAGEVSVAIVSEDWIGHYYYCYRLGIGTCRGSSIRIKSYGCSSAWICFLMLINPFWRGAHWLIKMVIARYPCLVFGQLHNVPHFSQTPHNTLWGKFRMPLAD